MASQQRYVSRELTHFVGRSAATDEDRYNLLVRVLRAGWLTHPPHQPQVWGDISFVPGQKASTNDLVVSQVVCFADIPTGDLQIHASKYGKVGLSFLKAFLTAKGVSPVFYIAADSTVRKHPAFVVTGPTVSKVGYATWLRGETEPCAEAFDRWIDVWSKNVAEHQNSKHQELELDTFLTQRVFAFLKFFDSRTADDGEANYYMEREWRVVGNIQFELSDVERILIPREFASRFRDDMPAYSNQITFLGE